MEFRNGSKQREQLVVARWGSFLSMTWVLKDLRFPGRLSHPGQKGANQLLMFGMRSLVEHVPCDGHGRHSMSICGMLGLPAEHAQGPHSGWPVLVSGAQGQMSSSDTAWIWPAVTDKATGRQRVPTMWVEAVPIPGSRN